MRLRNIIIGIITILCTACTNDDIAQHIQGGFHIALHDDATVTTRALPSELGAPVAARCQMRITYDKTGRIVHDGIYKEFVEAGTGDYTLTAQYGTDVELGINTPYYYGEAHACITAENLTPAVTIPCSVANSLLSVHYLDSEGNISSSRFDELFNSYGVRLDINRLSISLTEAGQSGYFRAGTMPRITFEGTLAATGRKVEYEINSADIPTALDAAEHLILNLTMERSAMGVIVEVAKAQVERVTVNETIPVDWLPAPKLQFAGSTSIIETLPVEGTTRATFTTSLPLQDVELTLDLEDNTLAHLNGVYNLSTINSEQKMSLATAGIEMPALGGTATSGSIDVGRLAGCLRTNDGTTTRNKIGLRVRANNRWSSDVPEVYTYKVIRPSFVMPVQAEGDAWSKSLYITTVAHDDVVADEEDKDMILGKMIYELSADGGSTWAQAVTTPADGKLFTTGLDIGTAYIIRARINGTSFTSDNTRSQVTESQPVVPNGDFEDMRITYNNTTIKQGGEYRRTYLGTVYGQNTQTFTVSEPIGWSSTNAKTCNLSASALNSWFCPLSVFNTSIAFQTNEAKISGLGGNTIHPAIYCEQKAQHGANAMVVRNVAYSANGTVPGRYTNTAATPGSNYYNKNTPSISHTAAGKLFIGSYTFSGGTETFNEGVNFASRPTALSGYYKYDTSKGSASDKGRVTVTLLNGSTTIATGTANLSAVGDYTQFNIPLNYTSTTTKATQLRIMIASGQSDNVATTKIAEYIQEAYGNVLCIDNLTFTYDK